MMTDIEPIVQGNFYPIVGPRFGSPEDDLMFQVKTTSADEDFALPLEDGSTQDFTVDWGDGSTDTITAWDDAAVTHTYADAGTYDVVITGTITGWRFSNDDSAPKIYEISGWGDLVLGADAGQFFGCENMTWVDYAIGGLDISNVTSLNEAFYGASSFNQSVANFDTSNVTDMKATFRDTNFNQPVDNFDTSSVTTIRFMFRNTPFNQSVAHFDISNVEDIGYTFYNSNFSDANYKEAIKSFAAQGGWAYEDWNKDDTIQEEVEAHFGSASLAGDAEAQDARAFLVDSTDGYSWVITDGD